jgi:predicted ArsR family transcriptional regulator
MAIQTSRTTLWRLKVFTRFNSRLPARPESVATVLKVLSQNDELMVKDIARLGRLTQSQARRALEELIASGKVVVRKLKRPRMTLYKMNVRDQSETI